MDSIATEEIEAALHQVAQAIIEDYQEKPLPFIVGIASGGIPVAKRLKLILEKSWGKHLEMGQLDISFHRDDIEQNPIPKEGASTKLTFDIEGKEIILIDDVISSGRTTRAALNELFDLGRPSKVKLAILFDRGGRCLPIHPDYTGFTKNVSPEAQVVATLAAEASPQDKIMIVHSL